MQPWQRPFPNKVERARTAARSLRSAAFQRVVTSAIEKKRRPVKPLPCWRGGGVLEGRPRNLLRTFFYPLLSPMATCVSFPFHRRYGRRQVVLVQREGGEFWRRGGRTRGQELAKRTPADVRGPCPIAVDQGKGPPARKLEPVRRAAPAEPAAGASSRPAFDFSRKYGRGGARPFVAPPWICGVTWQTPA